MRFAWRPETRPPRWARWLLAFSLSPASRIYALADLDEEFEERVHRQGTTSARNWYFQQVRGSLGPGLRHRVFGPDAPAGPTPAGFEPPSESHRRTGDFSMSDLLRDPLYACRSLLRSPFLLIVTILSLAVGIGATTAVFSIANALLFRQGAGPAPTDMVTIYTSTDDGQPHGRTSFPDYLEIEANVDALGRLAAFRIAPANLELPNAQQKLMTEVVTADYFQVRGLDPVLGRTFGADEVVVGSSQRVVVIGHRLWQQRFGGDTAVIGRSIRIDGHPFTVIGVAPEGISSRLFGLEIDAWLPLGIAGGVARVTPEKLADRNQRSFMVLGRLGEGKSQAQALAQLTVLGDRLRAEHGDIWLDSRRQPRSLEILGERESRIPPGMKAALAVASSLLVVAAGLLLFIACSNVAGLYLARAGERRREMALRLAIGASRRRLTTMLLWESILPAVVAGALGIGLAFAATRALQVVPLPIGLPLRFDFSPDLRVLGFTVLLSFVASLAFGLAPALEGARTDLRSSLGEGTRGSGTGRDKARARRLLVIAQVAVSLIFVIGSGLAWRSLGAAAEMDMGFDPDRLALISRSIPADRFDDASGQRFYRTLLEELRADPGLEGVHISTSAENIFPLTNTDIRVPGYEQGPEEPMTFGYNSITPGYAEMVDLPLLRGRTFDERDDAGAPAVAMVSRAFVDRFWPGSDGLGQRFEVASAAPGAAARSYEVIGVLRDAPYEGVEEPTGPFFWTSLAQQGFSRDFFVQAKGRSSTTEALAGLRRMEIFEGEALILPAISASQLLDFQFLAPRLMAKLLAWAGLFGLGLATLGIAGLVAFMVSQRRREMAIRQALGARPGQVRRSVLREGLRLVAWGLGTGLLGILALTRVLEAQLYGISPLDPVAIGGGCALLLAVAFLATWIPAQKATRIDPIRVLRED